MQATQLGSTGLCVSRLCLGTMAFGAISDKDTSFAIMDRALDLGIDFFDTANIYSRWIEGHVGGESERIIGEWLQAKSRHQVVLATKVRGRMYEGNNGEGLSRHHIISAVEDSLRRLKTGHIDLYQAHWFDANTPLEETLTAFDQLIRQGKVRYIGASNYPAWQLMKSYWVSDVHKVARYESLQPHYSIFHRKEYEQELAAVCVDQAIGVIPYSPLAAGFATGKYTRENKEPESKSSHRGLIRELVNNEYAFAALDVMREVANGHGVSVSHVALAWLLTKPNITAPIIGVRTVEQLEDVAGATELVLSEDEIQLLDDVTSIF